MSVHSEVALLLWANRQCQLLNTLVEARLNEIRSSQMTEVDDSIMYHAQTFNMEPETNTSDFSDIDEEELYHAQSQEQRRPATLTSPKVCAQSQLVNHKPTKQTPIRIHQSSSGTRAATPR